MSAGVEQVSRTGYQAWCGTCQDGINTTRQVDAHIWASTHNLKEHTK